MPNQPNHRASDRIRVELIEADVEIAFSLVDDAREEFHEGNRAFAHSALAEAEKVLTDIGARLHDLDPASAAPFGPLVDELRKSILAAQAECG
jgi:hypothetical protein